MASLGRRAWLAVAPNAIRIGRPHPPERAIKLRHLSYFVKIVDAGSFSRAATIAFVAQPALSLQIAELEGELGVTLLHRSARGVRPTPAGEVFYREAMQILQRVERLPELVRVGAGEVAGPVRLGMASTLASFLAGDFITFCRERLPRVTLNLISEDSATLKAKLLSHALDLAILFDADEQAAGLVRLPLFRQRLFLVDRKSPSRRAGAIALRQLQGRPLVLPGHGNAMRSLVDSHFARHGIVPLVAAEANVLSSILAAVRAGAGATIVPLGDFAGTPWENELGVRPIEPPIFETACAVWADNADLGSAGEAVHALLEAFTQRVLQDKARAGMMPIEAEQS